MIVSVATGASVASEDFTTNDSEVAAIDLQTGQLKTTFGTGGFCAGIGAIATPRLLPGGYPTDGGLHRLRSCDEEPLVGSVGVAGGHHRERIARRERRPSGRRLIAGTNSANCAGLLRMPDGRLAVAANDGGQAVVMFFDR